MAGLRERAMRHGHSVQEEVREILQAAAADRPSARALPPLNLVTVRAGRTSSWSREEIYADDADGR